MPIRIPEQLPAQNVLLGENIFTMESNRAANQDIRPLKVGILNLMPNKIETEVRHPKIPLSLTWMLSITTFHKWQTKSTMGLS